MELVEAHQRAIPMLQAREAILMSNAVAVGNNMDAKGLERVYRSWQREAKVNRVRKARTKEEFMANMAMLGIGVKEA